jgi:Ser/Thr protein kinase RdoA (MazF antagonist)
MLTPALDVVAGYHAVDPLSAADLALAAEFTVARVAARIIVAQWNATRDPANRKYLLRSTPQAIGQFTALRLLAPDEIARSFRAVCEENQ